MRDNYKLMSSLATHTRLNPSSRIEKLMSFNKRLLSTRNIVQELSEWNLQLDKKLLDIPGRVLAPEQLRFGGEVYIKSTDGDWTREMQNKKCLISQQLRDWVLIITERDQHALEVILYIYLQYMFTFMCIMLCFCIPLLLVNLCVCVRVCVRVCVCACVCARVCVRARARMYNS